ncbi:MAG: alanine--tRNA ligase [Armatimonadota bacterium]
MLSSEIREKYLSFFEGKGCLIAPSDSVVPNDPTLLFTSAGMVQFKPYFVGERVPPRTRMTTSQKCLRTGDLEIVGTTAFHHTFFEMLGNFSFGDYFKEETIIWAWEFLTGVLKLDPARLWVTVFKTDDEAAEIWEKAGIPTERIVRLGEKSNYWPSNAPSEGPNGPCGHCSEIFFDFGEEVGCQTPECGPDCDCGRFSEIWNLVFMQYDRGDGGTLTPLPQKNIDTGMGLERISGILQGVPTNFETDLFAPIVAKVCEIAGVKYSDHTVALRVIADHARSMTFVIADGVMPGNVGRGYVLRRIIRRAVLKGRSLGLSEPFLDAVIPVVIGIMKGQYPELSEMENHILRTVRAEEEKFLRTLDMGLAKLEDAISRLSGAEIPGMEAFVLYDTYGFPLELTQEIAAARGLTVDAQGFEEAMEEQRRKAREGSDISSAVFGGTLGALAEIEKAHPATDFVGYGTLVEEARIIGILKDGELVDSCEGEASVVLDATPFYPEGGGQVADTGTITGATGKMQVTSTARVGSLIVHVGKIEGRLTIGGDVTASVDTERRISTMRNHTATHLLHRALRMMLGEHVVQSGSLVEPSRLRFDFSHFEAVTPGELSEIEKIVNDEVLRDDCVETCETTLEQAKEDGAMALFSEKYAGTVRVVTIGDFSKELCGGTHVARTSQIGPVKIVAESSVGAGLRRIEAVTGKSALAYMRERDALLSRVADTLGATPAEAPQAAVRLVNDLATAEKRIEEFERKAAVGQADELAARAVELNGVKLVAEAVQVGDVDLMSALADALAGKLGSAVVVLGGPSDGKVTFVCKVTKDLMSRFHAGNLLREVAKVAGGGGGGRPDFAQAGGKDPSKLADALAKAKELVQSS